MLVRAPCRAVLIAAMWYLGARAVDGFVAGGLSATLRLRGPRRPDDASSRARWHPGVSMAVTDADTWVRPPPRGKRDIVFGTLVTASNPVSPKHDENCSLVR